MELYIIRHAEAEPAAMGRDDARRALTPKGAEAFAREVRGLEHLGVALDRVYHSPLLRAVETADLLAPLLDGESIVTPELAHPPSEEFLRSLSGERVAVVGHEPHVSDLLMVLVLGWRVFEPESQRGLIEFKKGAVAWLSGEPRPAGMTLVAFWPAKTLKKLAND
jgi:phosphohistidine phosphatase